MNHMEGVLMIITSYKVISYRNETNRALVVSIFCPNQFLLNICHPESPCLLVIQLFILALFLVREWWHKQLLMLTTTIQDAL